MAVTSGTMTTVENLFQLPITIDGSDKSYVLNTQGKYLNKNIGISVTTPAAGTFNVSSISGTSDVVATANGTKYDIKASNLNVKASMSSAGWVGTGTLTDSDTDNQTVGKMAAADATVSANVSAPTMTTSDAAISNKIRVSSTPTTSTSNVTKYYVAVKGESGAVTQGTPTIGTSGYLTNASQITANGVPAKNKNATYYIPLATAAATVSASVVAPTMATVSAAVSTKTQVMSNSTPTTTTTNINKYYIAVKGVSGAVTQSTPSIVTAGYIDTAAQITAEGVAAGDKTAIYYIPVTSAVASENTASATITTASSDSSAISLLSSAPSSGAYYTLTANGSGSSKITTAGWIDAKGLNTASTTKAYYLAKATGSTTGSGTAATATATDGTTAILTPPSASASATANGIDGGYYTDNTTSSYYIDCSASANSGVITATGGSATASAPAISATVSAGYNPAPVTVSVAAKYDTKTGASATSTATTASTSKKIYLKPATIAGSVTNASTAVFETNPGTVSIHTYNQATISGKTRIDYSPTTNTADISGTYYLAIEATAEAGSNATKAISGSGTATVTGAGYAPTTTTGAISVSGTATAKSKARNSSPTYIPLPTANIGASGGGLSATKNYSGTPTLTLNLAAQTTSGVTIKESGATGYYLTLTTTSNKLTGSTTVTRAAYNTAHTAGYLATKASSTVLAQTSCAASVTVNTATTTRYIQLPTATFAVSADKVYCSNGGWVPTGSTAYVVGTVTTGSITAHTADPGSSYTNNTNLVLTEGGWLRMTAGYYPATRISLATLIGDDAKIIPANDGGSPWVHPSYKAYDDQGRLLQGTMSIYLGEYDFNT